MLNLAPDAVEQGVERVDEDDAKAFVMAEIARIVEDGRAAMTRLESGVLELRFTTGELFHLGDEGITRTRNPPRTSFGSGPWPSGKKSAISSGAFY
jgi:hypothetical protein